MDNSNKADFQKMLDAVFLLYGKHEPDPSVVGMSWAALERFSLDDVRQGLNIHAQDTEQGQFLPKPADIIRGIEGSSGTRSEMAWTKVDKAVRGIGPNRTVVFDDPIIHTVISDMGGWIDLCFCNDKEYSFKHNEFVKRYKGYANRPQQPAPSKLIGVEESYNERNGFPGKDQPVLIGDKAQAMLVFQNGQTEKPKLFHSVDENTLLKLENKNGRE